MGLGALDPGAPHFIQVPSAEPDGQSAAEAQQRTGSVYTLQNVEKFLLSP